MGNSNATESTKSRVPPHILNLHDAAKRHDVYGLKSALAQFLVHQTTTSVRPPVRSLETSIRTRA